MDDIKKGTLSKEQVDEAVEWIKTHWHKEDKSCDICGANNWTICQDLVAPVVFTGGYTLGGAAYPQFMMMCNNCGNTKYFNAVISKILKEGGKKDA